VRGERLHWVEMFSLTLGDKMAEIYADFFVERKNDKWHVRAVTRFIENGEEKKNDEFISDPYDTEEEAEKKRLEIVDITKNFKLHGAAGKLPNN
jgi:hypothetical protein